MDYHFWNAVETKVYEEQREPFNNVEELKPAVKRAWRVVLDMNAIRSAILHFHLRLQEVVIQQGGPIQHIFG